MTTTEVWVDELRCIVARGGEARRVGSRHGHQWCHLWSDDVEALHAFAARIGMRRDWFQPKPGFPHYDLTPTRRARALAEGAIERSLRSYLVERRRAASQRDLG